MGWNFPSDDDNAMFEEKLDHPEKRVSCPKCGKPLEYLDHGTAWEVRCEKCGTRIVMRGF